jgi:peptidoglycan hydrolase CwlO-like protein
LAVATALGGGGYLHLNNSKTEIQDGITEQVGALTAELKSTREQFVVLQSQLADARKDFDGVKEDIKEVSKLHSEVSSLRQEVAGLQKDVDTLTADLKDRKQEERLNDLQIVLQKELAGLSDRITRLEATKSPSSKE